MFEVWVEFVPYTLFVFQREVGVGLLVVLQEALEAVRQVLLEREALDQVLGDAQLLLQVLLVLLELRHGHADHVDDVAEQGTAGELDEDGHGHLVLVLGRDVAVPHRDDGGDGPVEGVDVLDPPAGVLDVDASEPVPFRCEVGGEE